MPKPPKKPRVPPIRGIASKLKIQVGPSPVPAGSRLKGAKPKGRKS